MKVVTICGSMRFEKEMQKIAWELETTKGYSVIQCVYNVENNAISKEQTDKLNAAHFKKIDISDNIYVVNIGGYIGSQVEKEIEFIAFCCSVSLGSVTLEISTSISSGA